MVGMRLKWVAYRATVQDVHYNYSMVRHSRPGVSVWSVVERLVVSKVSLHQVIELIVDDDDWVARSIGDCSNWHSNCCSVQYRPIERPVVHGVRSLWASLNYKVVS